MSASKYQQILKSTSYFGQYSLIEGKTPPLWQKCIELCPLFCLYREDFLSISRFLRSKTHCALNNQKLTR